ncbi:MAG: mechanosensitive ion channel protein MscL [Microbacterium sp. SCN 70-200]|uniref:large conductance mechanosensitive channel protein MscL n=1 Tax=unclassified Microbacterium TaxID=2609290 RepID=UPI00086EE93A|nr:MULTISPECIES: large conductance mechanosensitive channel protein MscL [unclassified Microbacterium]MBN9213486.1 large conductance mechanosensitive channel protein MscL [Microbacterium sp.]ODT41690.1 MAG: mechanosensitive ion channel protein MscL [Microbacterium sp. SCN 70-200]OJV85118.1 MAG: mechanosensitive ion channel protein MscL [Microbacterium sp. 70-16]
MAEKKGLVEGFKEFIAGGNVIELAVAVVIGAAFAAIVNAAVETIINPLIGAFVPSGDLSSWTIPIPGLFDTAELGIGALISAVINFLAIALVVYLFIVRPYNTFKERAAAKAGVAEEEAAPLPTEQELLIQIRDLLEKQKSA